MELFSDLFLGGFADHGAHNKGPELVHLKKYEYKYKRNKQKESNISECNLYLLIEYIES